MVSVNKQSPFCTVLMAVHNGMPYVKETVESILNQTYKHFEFLIIDDCSSDGTAPFLQNIQDRRLRVIRNNKNLRLAPSLNKGISAAKGKYIIRIDADDIADPERIEKQVAFMEKNLDIGVCGSFLQTMGAVQKDWKFPVTNEAIKARLLFDNVLMHPTVIMRRKVFTKNNIFYRVESNGSEDYDLWIQMMNEIKFANLDEYLLRYRIHEGQMSMDKDQKEHADTIRLQILDELGLNGEVVQKNYWKLLEHSTITNRRDLFELAFTVNSIVSKAKRCSWLQEEAVKKELETRWAIMTRHYSEESVLYKTVNKWIW